MESYYKLKDGTEIYYIEDKVEQPKANLIINHGFAEHASRYDHVVKGFNDKNISVYRYDLRGHGRTKTKKGDIDNFFDFIEDADEIVEKILKEDSETPLFMLGHSMGGAITTIYGIKYKDKLKGQIFSGPAIIRSNEVNGIKPALINILSKIAPDIKIKSPLSDDLCSDPKVVEDNLKDSMVLRKASARFLNEFQNIATNYISENIKEYDYPCYITHGEEDNIISKDASVFLYNNISSEDKEIKIYDSLYHEILNEKNYLEIINDMSNWITNKI